MIYSILIQKGGTGKTTTAATLAQAAAYKGKNTLAIDMDPQANLTMALAADPNRAGVYEILHGMPAAAAIQTSPQGMDILTASPQLQTEKTAQGSARRLQEALQSISAEYDYIFIDTPATPGELQYNALQAADKLIMPLQADAYNLQSLYQTINTAEQIRATNKDLTLAGVIFTAYDRRPTVTRQMRDIITAKAAERGAPCLGDVRKAVVIAEAAACRESLYKYAPKSNPAQDYLKILNKL